MSTVYELGQPVTYIYTAYPRERAYGKVLTTFQVLLPTGTYTRRRVQRRGVIVGSIDNEMGHGHLEIQVRPDGAGWGHVDLVCEPNMSVLHISGARHD